MRKFIYCFIKCCSSSFMFLMMPIFSRLWKFLLCTTCTITCFLKRCHISDFVFRNINLLVTRDSFQKAVTHVKLYYTNRKVVLYIHTNDFFNTGVSLVLIQFHRRTLPKLSIRDVRLGSKYVSEIIPENSFIDYTFFYIRNSIFLVRPLVA